MLGSPGFRIARAVMDSNLKSLMQTCVCMGWIRRQYFFRLQKRGETTDRRFEQGVCYCIDVSCWTLVSGMLFGDKGNLS